MKIYFDGCSYTAGENYLSDYKEQRYSARVAKHFGAEEHNFARGGEVTLQYFDTLHMITTIHLKPMI